jgi:hypothetical protein
MLCCGSLKTLCSILREASLPVDVLANSNLGAAYEEIKLLDSRVCTSPLDGSRQLVVELAVVSSEQSRRLAAAH